MSRPSRDRRRQRRDIQANLSNFRVFPKVRFGVSVPVPAGGNTFRERRTHLPPRDSDLLGRPVLVSAEEMHDVQGRFRAYGHVEDGLSTEVVAGTACQPLKYPLRRVRCTRKFYATPSNEGLPPMGERL